MLNEALDTDNAGSLSGASAWAHTVGLVVAETGAEADAEADAETGAEADAETGAEAGAETGAKADAGTGPEAGAEGSGETVRFGSLFGAGTAIFAARSSMSSEALAAR